MRQAKDLLQIVLAGIGARITK